MNHDEIQTMLEGYVDETLDRSTRRAVDDHLAGCDECRQILDGVASVPLGSPGAAELDERVLRRSMRRATLRTVVDASLMLIGLWLLAWLVAVLVIQPLVIDRGDRAATMTQATLDLAAMLNPGAWAQDFTIESTSLTRTASAVVGLPVGQRIEPLGTVASRLGPLGFGGADGGAFIPYVPIDQDGGSDARAVLPILGEGTVATVVLTPSTPLGVEEAQALADSWEFDIALVWAGFGVGPASGGSPVGFEQGGTLGYGTCLGPADIDRELFGASSASSSQSGGFLPASVEGALDRVRTALDNLAERPEIGLALVPPVDEGGLERARDALNAEDPMVTMLVVTGPTPEVESMVESMPDAGASLLAVDFYNWSNPSFCRGER